MIAIAQFENRVSPRFDHAGEFVLVGRQPDGSVDRQTLVAGDLSPRERIRLLVTHRVQTLVCGGVESLAAQQLAACGIEVYAGVTGETEDALQCLLRGELEPGMMMGRGGRCQGRWRARAGCGGGRGAGSGGSRGGGCGRRAAGQRRGSERSFDEDRTDRPRGR